MTTFLTGNAVKFELAQRVFNSYGLPLVQMTLDLPEVQSLDVVEVASLAAEDGARQLEGLPVFTSDVGYYIEALNGFPGPMIKFVNQTLTSEQLLRLMHGETNRRVEIRECIAYKAAGQPVKTFVHSYGATLETAASGQGLSVNQILTIDGMGKTIASLTHDEFLSFLTSNILNYRTLAEFLAKK